jgi:hypothetical protein
VGSPRSVRELLWPSNGAVRWTRDVPLDSLAGEAEPATVLDVAGSEIAQIELGVTSLDHSDSKFITLPEPGPRWATIVWSGGKIQLSNILPP